MKTVEADSRLSENVSDRIANEIEAKILETDVDRLPTEFELTEEYKVSRTTIREALNILKERGLVKSKVGEGSFITKPGVTYLSNIFYRMIVHNNVRDSEVSQIRVILESGSAYLAAKNKTPEFIKALSNNLEEMKRARGDLDRRITLDVEFHKIITRQSDNPILITFVESIDRIMYDYIKCRLLERPQGNEDGILWHSFLVNVLANGTPRECEDSMKSHLLSSFYQVESGKAIKYWIGYSLKDKKKQSLGKNIANHIEVTYLMDGPGKRLPTENELAKKFGVSRTVIREALGLLKATGLIESRVGVGAFSTGAGFNVEETVARMNRSHHYKDEDILYMRMILEKGAAALAADNVTPQFISILKENLDEMKAIPYENISHRIDVDMKFHYTIASQSNNNLLLIFIQSLTSLTRNLIEYNVINHPESYQVGIEWHERLINAFENGGSLEPEMVMISHLTDRFHKSKVNDP